MSLLTIERIEDAGPDRRARRLFFTGDIEPRLTSAAVVRSLGLAEGDAISMEQVDDVEPGVARERALKYLGYRERSSQDLRERLTRDGYPTELANAITDRFIELGLVDDERYARLYARTRAAAGYGVQRILRELRMHGIDEEIANASVIDPERDPLDAARRVLKGRIPSDGAERQRMVRKLVARGFPLDTALRATGNTSTDSDE